MVNVIKENHFLDFKNIYTPNGIAYAITQLSSGAKNYSVNVRIAIYSGESCNF